MADTLKLIRLILSPLAIFSLAIYICLYFLSPLTLAYQVALLLGAALTVLFFYLEKPNWKKVSSLLFSWRSLLLLVPVLFIIFVFGFVLSPMVKTVSVDGREALGLTALGDYYKHLYVLSSVKATGVPPQHPFYPSTGLSYYYGYYLLPAAISSVFSLDLARVFFFYLLFTTFLILLVVVQLSLALFRSWYQRLMAFTLFIFGTGLDIIPTLIQAKAGILTANHIEFWSQILNLNNYLVNNLYTVLLWVPQHALPSLIVLVTGLLFLKQERVSPTWLVLSIWYCLISSTFVSITFVIWLGLIFFFKKESRLGLVLSGLVALVLLLPYLTQLVGRESILSFGFYMSPFRYLPFLPSWINYALTFFTEYGLILISLPIFAILHWRAKKTETLLITAAISLPIIIGLFVRSSGFNDFSMRSILPSQMALPFLMAFCLDSVASSVWKKTVFLLLLLSFIPSMTGFFYEVHFRLIDRGAIPPQTSEFLINLRSNPISNLAVIDRDDWVFVIPSYGYQPVYSPHLFDSIGYLTDTGLKQEARYASSVHDLFINETVGASFLEVNRERLSHLQTVGQFFSTYQDFNFVLPHFRGEKSGINPWLKVLELSGAPSTKITDDFYLFSGQDLKDLVSREKFTLTLGTSKKVFVENKGLSLGQGLWFIVACSSKSANLKLGFVDQYTLINQGFVGPKICAGNIFYQSREKSLIISETSQFEELYLSPVTAESLTGPFWSKL